MDKLIPFKSKANKGKELWEEIKVGVLEDEYITEVHCKNCGERYIAVIPKGEKVDVFLLKNKCVNCGCLFI